MSSVPATLAQNPETATLVAMASGCFRHVDFFAYRFARSKLRLDPAFVYLLQEGLLSDSRHILDLGCGQGLLPAWLAAARKLYAAGSWPSGWPPAPAPVSIHGIDAQRRNIARAQCALAGHATFVHGDIRNEPYGPSDSIVMLDVLHYLSFDDQERVIGKARAALRPQGLLLLRIADASAGTRFLCGRWADRLRLLFDGRIRAGLCYRTIAQWRSLLRREGLSCAAVPMSAGTPFANVLLIARPI